MSEKDERIISTLEDLYRMMMAASYDLQNYSDEGRKKSIELANAATVVAQWIEELKR